MAAKVWLILFAVFAGFSWMVYAHCDDSNAEGPPGAMEKQGWAIWQQYNCQSCHQLYGLGGYMGPDLTNIYSMPGKGAAYINAFVKHGTGRMPDFNLDKQQAEAIVAFLAWVDKSGKSKITGDRVHWTGTYDLDKK